MDYRQRLSIRNTIDRVRPAGCGMETKRAVKEDENAAGLGTTHWRMQARLPLKHV